MSSYRAAEQLSFAIIKGALKVVGDAGRVSIKELTRRIGKALSSKEQQMLAKKGGDREIRRLIYYLDHRGYLASEPMERGQKAYTITTRGWRRLEELAFEPLAQQLKQPWDGKWRVLVFDIPESKRVARDALRRLIKQLGFRQLQKSVWIQPLPCREEIQSIQDAYGVKDHITLLEVGHFDEEPLFRRLFAKQINR